MVYFHSVKSASRKGNNVTIKRTVNRWTQRQGNGAKRTGISVWPFKKSTGIRIGGKSVSLINGERMQIQSIFVKSNVVHIERIAV
jgi:hypothetical protein